MWYQYAQLLSLAMALLYMGGLRRHGITAFIPLLAITNAIEFIGMNYKFFGWANNYFLYNIYILATTPLYLYLFYNMLQLKPGEQRRYKLVAAGILLLIIVNYCFIQGPVVFNTYSLVLFELMNILLSSFVLLRLVLTDGQDPLLKKPYFWINSVTFLFGLVTLVLLGLQQYIAQKGIKLNNKSLYFAILPAANIILYLGYSYAFYLCRTPRANS